MFGAQIKINRGLEKWFSGLAKGMGKRVKRRASKRLWVGKGLDGLLGRREDETRLTELEIKIH